MQQAVACAPKLAHLLISKHQPKNKQNHLQIKTNQSLGFSTRVSFLKQVPPSRQKSCELTDLSSPPSEKTTYNFHQQNPVQSPGSPLSKVKV